MTRGLLVVDVARVLNALNPVRKHRAFDVECEGIGESPTRFDSLMIWSEHLADLRLDVLWWCGVDAEVRAWNRIEDASFDGQ